MRKDSWCEMTKHKRRVERRLLRVEIIDKIVNAKHTPPVIPMGRRVNPRTGEHFSTFAQYKEWLINPDGPWAPLTEEQADEVEEYYNYLQEKNRRPKK